MLDVVLNRGSLFFPGLLAGLMLWAAPGRVEGQDFSRALNTSVYQSLSQQFIIQRQPEALAPRRPLVLSNDCVRLEPNLLAISCERIKRALMLKLGQAGDPWRGKIYLQVHPARSLNESIQLNATLYADGWAYRVLMPDALERSRLISTLVEVLLLEFANRNATGRSAEIPAWVVQGFTQDLMQDRQTELVLQPPRVSEAGVNVLRLLRSETITNSLAVASEQLKEQPPLTIQQLSWPGNDPNIGPSSEAFRGSSQLLVCELLRLPEGRAQFQAFLNELPGFLNWQLAFLKGFHAQFASQRDFEKWWAIQAEGFTKRDLSLAWSNGECFKKLDEIIRPPVEVRAMTNDLPLRTEVSLQTIIREWDYLRQSRTLQVKIQQLILLRSRASRDVIRLVDAYRQVLETYLERANRAGVARLRPGMSSNRLERVIQETVRALDGLDAQREALHGALPETASAGGVPNVQ